MTRSVVRAPGRSRHIEAFRGDAPELGFEATVHEAVRGGGEARADPVDDRALRGLLPIRSSIRDRHLGSKPEPTTVPRE